MAFSPELRSLLYGNPFGQVFPPKPNPANLAFDGRTAALRTLRKYITNLDFYQQMPPGQRSKKFSIEPENFHIEEPDHVTDTLLPSIVVIPSRAEYESCGLVAYIEEDSRDVFKQGTVIQWQSSCVEKIQLEVWASSKALRRGICAGIETAMSPTEQMSGLRFRMPDYFDQLVNFSLNKREIMQDSDSLKNRRKAQFEIEFVYNVVALVNYASLEVTTQVEVNHINEVPFYLDDMEDT